MGIKLAFMKKLLIIGILSVVSCKTKQFESEKEWIRSYKSIVVYSCLCELTKDGIDKELVKHNDISFMVETEILDSYYSREADSTGRDYAKKVEPVFSDDSEFSGRKAIFTSCLSLYENKKINKIVSDRHRKHKS